MRGPKQDIHFREELPDCLASALSELVAAQPSSADLAKHRRRLQLGLKPSSVSLGPSQHDSRRGNIDWWGVARSTIAAAALFSSLWLGAQTEVWGQVATDFASARLDSEAATSAAFSNDKSIDSLWRFILMVHVTTLMAGLLGMFWAWARANWVWLRSGSVQNSAVSDGKRATQPWLLRILSGSLVLYAVGILLGCLWASQVWGAAWRWDPREAFGLVTLAIATIWLTCVWSHQQLVPSTRALAGAIVATFAFWMIALLHFLGPIYAARQHSYEGFGTPLPTLLCFALAGNLLAIGALFVWRRMRLSPVNG